MSAGQSVAGNLTINGGNKVTLDAGGTLRHFAVQAGGHLTLNQIALANGSATSDCGGALNVASGAQLTLNEARLVNNHSLLKGGALCNQGSTDIVASLFRPNSSSSPGGAIQSSGRMTITGAGSAATPPPITGVALTSAEQ